MFALRLHSSQNVTQGYSTYVSPLLFVEIPKEAIPLVDAQSNLEGIELVGRGCFKQPKHTRNRLRLC